MNVLPPSLPLPDPSDVKALWDDLRKFYERTAAAVNSLVPTGTVWPSVVPADGVNWLACGGQAVSRTQYAGLFALVGTRFGAGDGLTTFNVPTISALVTHVTYNIRT